MEVLLRLTCQGWLRNEISGISRATSLRPCLLRGCRVSGADKRRRLVAASVGVASTRGVFPHRPTATATPFLQTFTVLCLDREWLSGGRKPGVLSFSIIWEPFEGQVLSTRSNSLWALVSLAAAVSCRVFTLGRPLAGGGQYVST